LDRWIFIFGYDIMGFYCEWVFPTMAFKLQGVKLEEAIASDERERGKDIQYSSNLDWGISSPFPPQRDNL
jgi:hypothetical protein